MSGIKEYLVAKNGFLFKEMNMTPVFCKPKLIPLKSVTIEKLEQMQKEARERLLEIDEQQRLTSQVNEIGLITVT
jgi:BBSome-interacting protein 1